MENIRNNMSLNGATLLYLLALLLLPSCAAKKPTVYQQEIQNSTSPLRLEVKFDDYKESKQSDSYAVVFVPVAIEKVIYCDLEDSDNCNEHSENGLKMDFVRIFNSSAIFRSQSKLTLDKKRHLLFLGFKANSTKADITETIYTQVRQKSEVIEEDEVQPRRSSGGVAESPPTTLQPAPQQQSQGLLGILAGLFGNGSQSGGQTNQNQNSNGTQSADSDTSINPTDLSDDELVPNPNNVPLSSSEFAVIKLTNQARIKTGKKALIVQEKIMVTSRQSSKIMQQRSRLKHGFTSGWRAENIAMGQNSPEAVMRSWLNSSGHYRNIMGNHTYIGVGDTLGSGRAYWTQQFN